MPLRRATLPESAPTLMHSLVATVWWCLWTVSLQIGDTSAILISFGLAKISMTTCKLA